MRKKIEDINTSFLLNDFLVFVNKNAINRVNSTTVNIL